MPPLQVVFGHLRMASDGVDTSSLLGAYLAMTKLYNEEQRVPGVEFHIDVMTVHCMTMAECRNLSPANEQTVANFLAKMPTYTAALRPNFLLAGRVVDEARRLGIPVMNPEDMRPPAFTNISEVVIQFHQGWRLQSQHIFTYMHQTERCAYSAIIHDESTVGADYDYPTRLASIQKLFTDGEFAKPPTFDVPASSDAAFERFFREDAPRRRCFIVMGTNGLLTETMGRLIRTDWYNPDHYRFYGFSTMGSDALKLNGTAKHFENVVMSHWAPPLNSALLASAYAAWYAAEGTTSGHLIGSNEVFPLEPTFVMLQGYFVITTSMEMFREALSKSDLLVDTSLPRVVGKPLPWPMLVDALYASARQIDGHWLNHLVRTCLAPPAAQDACFCNILTANSYIYRFNTTTGKPYVEHDDPRTGLRNVADQHFPSNCGFKMSSWSYPITGLAMFPANLIADGGFREGELLEKYRIFETTFAELTRETNYAPVPPTRALNYAAFKIDDGDDEQALLEHYIDTVHPFVIYGTMGKTIRDPKGILTLSTNLVDVRLEDPPLVPHDQWRWEIIALRPCLADYIHALAGYYADGARTGRFTSLRVLAGAADEAKLISKSLATWGFDVPTSAIPVMNDAAEWERRVVGWLSDSTTYNPFVLVVSNANTNGEVQRVARAASLLGRGTLAIACSLAMTESASHSVDFSALSPSSNGDVVFGAFVREWWLESSMRGIPDSLRHYGKSLTLHIGLLSIEVAKVLMAQVYFDYKTTAAQVLYGLSVVTAHGQSFGPFSNETCPPDVIAANSRDRNCQCTKGLRTLYVMSMRDFFDNVPSTRTNRFTWTMTTCGIVYSEYVPPPADAGPALSSGAIGGIAAGGAALLLAVAGAAVYFSLTSGRDNKSAPKDASKPFTIVFTDIQSSTALWARAPQAMSEAVDQHHRIVRRCVRRHSGYEVKTVGDCFMVAFCDVEKAVSFSLDVQTSLMDDADWNSEIDATYVELLIEAEVYDENGRFLVGGGDGGEDLQKYPRNRRGGGGAGGWAETDGGGSTVFELSTTGYKAPLPFANNNNAIGGAGLHQHRPSGVAHSYYSASHFNANAGGGGAHITQVAPFMSNLNSNSNSNINAAVMLHSSGQHQHQQQHINASPTPYVADIHSLDSIPLSKAAMNPSLAAPMSTAGAAAPRHGANNNAGVTSNNANSGGGPLVGIAAAEGGGGFAPAVSGSSLETDVQLITHIHGRLGASAPQLHSVDGTPTPRSPTNANGNSNSSGAVGLHQHHRLGSNNPINTNINNILSLSGSSAAVSPMSAAGGGDEEGRVGGGGGKAAPELLYPMALSATNPQHNHSQYPHQQSYTNAGSHQQQRYTNTNTHHLSIAAGAAAAASGMGGSSHAAASSQASDQSIWHGLRVRIGVHHGMGDIRKDPVTLGYDYYGTVVNTAARVEGVGHGGQILITEGVYSALSSHDSIRTHHKAVLIALGPQPLRGLDEPIKLYQLVPERLQRRLFPPLRLHIEKESEEGDTSAFTGTGDGGTTTTGSSADTATFEAFIARVCAMRQYAGSVTADDLTDRYLFFTQLFSTATTRHTMAAVAKLAELWSLDKATLAAAANTRSSEADRMRVIVNLLAKVTRAYNAACAAPHNNNHNGGAGGSNHRGAGFRRGANHGSNNNGEGTRSRSYGSQHHATNSNANNQHHARRQYNAMRSGGGTFDGEVSSTPGGSVVSGAVSVPFQNAQQQHNGAQRKASPATSYTAQQRK